jgi:hypothetical protein
LDSQVNWECVEVSGVSQFLVSLQTWWDPFALFYISVDSRHPSTLQTVLFVARWSNIDVVRSCIDGAAAGAVYIDNFSNFPTAFTFIDPDFEADAVCMVTTNAKERQSK